MSVPVPGVRVISTRSAQTELLTQIRRLLDEAFDGDLSDEDWEHTLGGWHIVIVGAGTLLSHAAVVPRVLEASGRPLRSGYVEGVATAARRQGEGLGSRAMSHAGELIRTSQDDDGLMVLRFGPSLELDLTGPISCEARRGDDW